jgi:glycosyltransferase involved in cell wall biosynthesis
MLSDLKVALVHEWLTVLGGSERVVKSFTRLFPEAPIYTSVFQKKNLGDYFSDQRIVTSWLQKIPFATKLYTKFLPLLPGAFEKFNLMDYDVVLSSSSSCAKGVITKAESMHVSYIHSPMRYAWDLYFDYMKDSGPITKFFYEAFDAGYPSMGSPQYPAGRLSSRQLQHSGQENREVLPAQSYGDQPAVDTHWFEPAAAPSRDYYYILSRLIPYKRIDLAVKAFNQLGRRLLIAGSGPELKNLKSMAKSNVEFLGRVSEEDSKRLYQNAKAFLFPGFEDFGITPVEAMASGTPVIAYGKGGVTDSVVPGKTGVFFPKQTTESLITGIEEFESLSLDPRDCRKRADFFSVDNFEEKMTEFIQEKWQEFSNRRYEIR